MNPNSSDLLIKPVEVNYVLKNENKGHDLNSEITELTECEFAAKRAQFSQKKQAPNELEETQYNFIY